MISYNVKCRDINDRAEREELNVRIDHSLYFIVVFETVGQRLSFTAVVEE